MANTASIVSSIPAFELISEGGTAGPSGGQTQPYALTAVGVGAGISFAPKTQGAAIYGPFRVAAGTAFTTGLKVDVFFCDDPGNASPGNVGFFDATIGPFTSGTTTLDETSTGPFAASTAVTASLTTAAALATTGGVKTKVATISIPSADLNSLAAGGWAALRLRRLGTNSSDTHGGRIVVLGVDIYDY